MNLIKPKKLKQGDTIGLLSISGDIDNYENIQNAENFFRAKGYKTIVSETTYKHFRYHAGSDEERVLALHKFFTDKDVDAIVCTCGGYGLIRIIDKIDYRLIAKNPKIFCGYSDITALLTMMCKKSHLLCFQGPMASGDFGIQNVSYFTEKSFFETLTGAGNNIYTADECGQVLHKGVAKGILWGGNLTTIASMAGNFFIPNEKFVFFIEDVNEPAYKVDRMLTQLFRIEKFAKNIQGLAVGVFSGVGEIKYVNEVLEEYTSKYNIPCCDGFKISHERDKYTLPIGVKCELSADEKFIKINENLFSD